MTNLMPLVLLNISKDGKNLVHKWWFGRKGKNLSLYENTFFNFSSQFPHFPLIQSKNIM